MASSGKSTEQQEQCLKIAADIYSRNYIISEAIKQYKKEKGLKTAKILDVGGRGGRLELFLDPEDEVVLLDIRPGEEANLIVGDATDMKMFKDKSFDIVTSGDVFEHIPAERRERFVSECLRVSKDLMILAGPFGTEGVAKAEKTANEYFKKLTGVQHEWLREHQENTLPVKKDLEDFLKKQGYKFSIIQSNNLENWIILQLFQYFTHLITAYENLEKVFVFYNQNIQKIEPAQGMFYRQIFFVSQKNFKPSFHYTYERAVQNEFFAQVFTTISELYHGFSTEAHKVIKNKEEQINGKEAIIQKLNADLQFKDVEINSLQDLPQNEKITVQKETQMLYESTIQDLKREIRGKDEFKRKLDKLIADKDNYIRGIEPDYMQFQEVRRSWFFVIYKIWRLIKRLFLRSPVSILRDLGQGLVILKKHGSYECWRCFKNYLYGKSKAESLLGEHTNAINVQYQTYLTKQTNKEEAYHELPYQPLISVIMPVCNIQAKWLNKAIKSVLHQIYQNWELCIHDDGSTKEETLTCLRKWQEKDKRIKISFGKRRQHISLASNAALSLAKGEFVTFLDHDDTLTSDALYEVAQRLNKHPELDLLYSDEDKVDEEEVLMDPFFKPDWSPDLFFSVNYLCHLVIVRKKIGDRVEWFRAGYEGAQDYDFLLRVIGETSRILHIPKVLYHWRMLKGSTAKDVSSKSYAHEAGVKALKEYFNNKNIKVTVKQGFGSTNYKVAYKIQGTPKVSIIIPFKDQVTMLKKCVNSILLKTKYENYEIILVSNNSKRKNTFDYLKTLERKKNIKVLHHDVKFNFAELNNWAVKQTAGEYLLFLNNDTEVINKDWLRELLVNASRKEVGAVGAKLLYPDGTIQHAGVILGMTGLAGHIFAHQRAAETYYRLAKFRRNYLAVTAACLMVAREKFNEIGGFNEKFTICGNDVDLCLSLYEKGYLNVYTPYAKLYHHESATRDPNKIPKCDFDISRQRYKPYLGKDPYYNPNLSLAKEIPAINLDLGRISLKGRQITGKNLGQKLQLERFCTNGPRKYRTKKLIAGNIKRSLDGLVHSILVSKTSKLTSKR
ncbi:MAG: glycosyltransferase [Candidatus Gracilibacteria bacterium]|nr:glycosyltransferase [Candidatus Gracilibacteria bacterium]